MKRLTFSLFIITILLVSCNGRQEVFFSDNRYAQEFSIERHQGYSIVNVRYSDEANLTRQYILVPKAEELPADLPKGTIIRTPVERVISFSSITCSMIEELGMAATIVGITEADYINSNYIRQRLNTGEIADLGMPANPDIEKMILLEPEIIFFNPYLGEDTGPIRKTSFPVFFCTDYRENHPLGQTEWIKLMGLLFGKEELADSLFNNTEFSYNKLKQLTEKAEYRPCVFTETKYGDFWYVPGGKSYMANLLRDAGADYRWKDDESKSALNLPFEQVLDEAENCDYWLIKKFLPQGDITYDMLTGEYPNYALFSAFKNKNTFACNTSKARYYEDLPLHPDRILEDLIYIFHPELLPDYQARYYFPVK